MKTIKIFWYPKFENNLPKVKEKWAFLGIWAFELRKSEEWFFLNLTKKLRSSPHSSHWKKLRILTSKLAKNVKWGPHLSHMLAFKYRASSILCKFSSQEWANNIVNIKFGTKSTALQRQQQRNNAMWISLPTRLRPHD